MKRLRRLILVLPLLLVATVGTHVTPASADNFTSPAAMLTSYYNDINLHQYQTAYGMWVKAPQTYDAFVAGYADTDHVVPYLGDYTRVAGDTGSMPGVLVGYKTDGSIVAYHGCFDVLLAQQQPLIYAIVDAKFSLLSNSLPDNDLIMAYLSADCSSNNPVVVPTLTPTPDNGSGGDMAASYYQALTSYYEFINRRDYADAYALWLHPLPGPKPNGAPPADYRTPYAQFVSGYSTTKYVDVYLGVYDEQGGYMGHGYVDGEFPVLLVGEHTDGTFMSFIGCYVMGGMQD